MSWAGNRQLKIVSVLAVLLMAVLGMLIYPHITKPPTCFDGKQNGSELGIDCGGECQKICSFQTAPIVVKWARAFPVTDSVWNVVALVENPNRTAGIPKISYEFRIKDKNNEFIALRDGETFIAPNSATAIFEGQIVVGNRVPVFTTLTFTSTPTWYQVDPRYFDMAIASRADDIIDQDTKPKFSATITNTSPKQTIGSMDVIALLYNADGNAIQVAKTISEGLAPVGSDTLYFTWPKPLSEKPVRSEIYSRVNPFTQRYK